MQEADEVKERFYRLCEWILTQVPTRLFRQISDSTIKQKALAYLMRVNGGNEAGGNLAGGESIEQG